MSDTKHHIELKRLTKDIVRDNIDVFIEISKQFEGDYWEAEHYLSDLNRKWELSTVVYADGVIAGFNLVSEKPTSLHIHRIAAAKEFHNYGIGRRMVEQTIADARNTPIGSVTLKVHAPTQHRLDFYKKFNFDIAGTQGEMLLMELKLTS